MGETLAKERAQPPEYADMPRRAPDWDRADAYQILEQKKQWLSAPFVPNDADPASSPDPCGEGDTELRETLLQCLEQARPSPSKQTLSPLKNSDIETLPGAHEAPSIGQHRQCPSVGRGDR